MFVYVVYDKRWLSLVARVSVIVEMLGALDAQVVLLGQNLSEKE